MTRERRLAAVRLRDSGIRTGVVLAGPRGGIEALLWVPGAESPASGATEVTDVVVLLARYSKPNEHASKKAALAAGSL